MICINLMSKESITNIAENKFKEWLDKHNIPYWYVQQDIDTFSKALKKFFGAKRPDFMILLPNIGFIFVDVEDKKVYKNFGTFALDSDETAKYSNLQRNFNIQVWYAISNEDSNYNTWYWIPASKVLEIGKLKKVTSGVSGEEFFPIPIAEFIQISTSDSLGRLFAKMFSEID